MTSAASPAVRPGIGMAVQSVGDRDVPSSVDQTPGICHHPGKGPEADSPEAEAEVAHRVHGRSCTGQAGTRGGTGRRSAGEEGRSLRVDPEEEREVRTAGDRHSSCVGGSSHDNLGGSRLAEGCIPAAVHVGRNRHVEVDSHDARREAESGSGHGPRAQARLAESSRTISNKYS